MLSSTRPDVFPRFRSRLVMTFSVHSNISIISTQIERPQIRSHPFRLFILRGKPSTRNMSYLCLSLRIASCSSLAVTSTGTIFPSRIKSSIILPCADPFFLSSLSKSPADRCFALVNSAVSLLHCVPFPAPGPPRMKMTCGILASASHSWLLSGTTKDLSPGAAATFSAGAAAFWDGAHTPSSPPRSSPPRRCSADGARCASRAPVRAVASPP
mmetsp:Transcript_56227/g.137907  ORF Transcript_56227/g.137907 Transcript_56227/m.137907 type:complete len:213 (-) Transcript_56227:193-831(-)